MDCFKCGGTYTEKSGMYLLPDPYVGKIIAQGVSYYQCDNCEDTLYSEEMAQAIESERNTRIQEILSQFPIRDFINAADTASVLGISRQALHKNSRIKHGFIYQTKFGVSTLYLKKSVQQYRKTGDGRFSLHSHGYSHFVDYVKPTVRFRILAAYEVYSTPRKPMSLLFEQKRVSPKKEYCYAN